MERNFKYFMFGLMCSVCGVVSLGCLGFSIYGIINLHKETGWFVVLDLALIIFFICCFWSINWCYGKMVYYGSHLNSKIWDKAPNQELFEIVKQEKFYWNCTYEEIKDEENPEKVSVQMEP